VIPCPFRFALIHSPSFWPEFRNSATAREPRGPIHTHWMSRGGLLRLSVIPEPDGRKVEEPFARAWLSPSRSTAWLAGPSLDCFFAPVANNKGSRLLAFDCVTGSRPWTATDPPHRPPCSGSGRGQTLHGEAALGRLLCDFAGTTSH
jgi:hypothetical protein